MDKIFIRERINVVDYENKNKGLLYTSSGIDVEGGIVNVQLESDVAGWHQLSFDIPAFLIKDGKQIQNPLLKHLFPLTKLQYTRVVKEGDEEKELILYFIVQPQEGSRDDSGIVLYSYTCIDYPRHNLSKAKNGITIGEDTLDNKRSMTPNNEIMDVPGKVIYVKAPVQERTFNNYLEMGQWLDAKPGAFATVGDKHYRLTGADPARMDSNNTILLNWFELGENQSYTIVDGKVVADAVWSPEWGDYPLPPDPNNYEFGDLGVNDIDPSIVQFYWDTLWTDPNKTIGRYDGLLYQEGSRLLYEIFETLDYEMPANFLGTYYLAQNLDAIGTNFEIGTTAYVLETGTVWQYNGSTFEDTFKNKREAFKVKPILKGDWSKLDPLKPYLAPNYAEKYLDYILEGTGWKVGEVDKIMVDNGTVEKDENGVVMPEQKELTTYLYFDNSNAYNAISELCNAFKCYARFDHVNKIVHLKSIPGEDNNLIFQYRDNLANSRIVQDGEKAVSKLWVYGGEDLNGPVYIQDCNRMNPDYYLADYTSLDDLKERTTPKPNDYAKISIPYKWSDLVSQTLKDGERLPIVNTFNAGELKVTSWGTGVIPTVETLKDLPANGSLGQTVFVIDQNSYWSWVPEANSWYDTYLEDEPTDANEKVVFEQRYDYALIKENVFDWVDKGQFYHWYEPMSPFADNYILDFRYFLDRNLMTEEQVEDIKYNYVLPISRLNRKRWPLYKEYQNLNQQLLTWNATYDECKIARDAIDKSIRTNYAIYEKNADGDIVLKETNVSAYPPGANINTTGWVEAAIVYSESDAPEVATYADMPKSPKIGDYVRVKDEAKVYVQTATYQFEDTICAYLGWNEGDIKNTAAAADMRKKEWLFSNDGKIEARVRNEGLFQKFRDEELFGDKGDREKLAPWYNPPANIKEVPKGPTGDPDETSTMHPYYDAQSRFVTEQINMNDALDRITTIEEQLTYLLKKIELLENGITALEHGLREKYGDYLVEGVFTDDTMVWIYNLWYAGLEALELYHRPLVTYELGVVDVSGLPEYRTVTTDIYHDIVYRLNQANLVLPNPGDYCYVTDNKLGIVREKANITSTIRNLSNPSQHQITIATVDTNTEDLIGKVVTAANTIYSKEQIYNRSAIVNADGTIAQDSITSSLDDNSGKITVMSNNGTVLLGDNGIITTDRDNALLRMQYTGKGIFSSTNGGVTWENIVNAGKISIKSLSAGSIDSNSISISNIGHDASIIIDGKGISAVNYSGATSSPTLDALKVDDHTSFFLDAQTGNAYFRGHLVAASGDIAGWQIGKTALTKGNTGMSSSGDYAFWAGNATAANAPFWVKHDGSVKASNADITGKIVVTNSNSTVNTGTVGGWKADSDGLSNGGKLVLSPSGGAITGAINNSGSRSDWAIFMNGNFGVLTNGTMYAANANIKGHIEATSGTFSGTIEAATIKGSTVSGTTITGGSINCQDVNIKGAVNATSGTFKGTVYASAGSFKGKVEATSGSFKGSIDATDGTFRGNLYTSSGTLGPWTISGSGLLDGSGNGLRVGNYADGSATRYRTIVDSSKGIALHVRSTSNTDNICLKPGNITHGLFVGRCSGINAIYVNSHNAVILQNNGRASSYNSTNGLYYDRDNNGVDISSPHNMVQVGAQISSRDMKYDITRLDNEELSDLWKLYQELNTYKFKYKYGRLKGESDFGFIIDEFLEKSNSNMWVQKMSLEEDPRYVDHVTGTLCVNRSDLTDPDRSSMVHNYQYDREEINKMNMIVCSMLVNKIEQLEKEIEILKKES
jgi:hypothetical protein